MRFGGLWCAFALLASASAVQARKTDSVVVTPLDPEAKQAFPVSAPEGLPPEVERLVRFYASALSAEQPAGGSIELALGPDSNINRVTRADALGGGPSATLGPGMTTGAYAPTAPGMPMDDFHRPHAGTGLVGRGQAWLRRQLDNEADLLVQLSGNGSFYKDDRFDDYALAAQAGPEWLVGRDRLAVLAGPAWRWYGTRPYSRSLGALVSWQHPVRRGQLRVEGGVARVDNRLDPAQDAWTLTAAATFDRRLSARSGAGLQLQTVREIAREPGYSTVTLAASAYAFRALGRTTVAAMLAYAHLEADHRLIFDFARRVDDRVEASLAATFRALSIGPLAPFARVRWERNRSRLDLYDFRRTAGEVGLTASF